MQPPKPLKLMPPAPGRCQQCAVIHDPEMPHDANSLYYAFWYQQEHGKSPSWADAMAHCEDGVKSLWLGLLAQVGIDPNDPYKKGRNITQEELDRKLGVVPQE